MDVDKERELMLRKHLQGRGITNQLVLQAMRDVQRHHFIGTNPLSLAYGDFPIHIGFGQTISQPYMVALMTQCLQPFPGMKVLEIGTGSGYQTAILASIGSEVYTIERIAELSSFAQKNMEKLNLTSIHFKTGDGTLGWSQQAPFDRIIVTAAAPTIPESLIEQLQLEGILVIPVGDRFFQTLKVVHNTEPSVQVRDEGGCIFVKLIGAYGWAPDDE